MGAAPGGVLRDLDLHLRRVALQELAVVGESDRVVFFHLAKGIGEGHVAVAVVVAVGLAVGRDVDQLRPRGPPGLGILGGEGAEEPADQGLAAREEPIESDGARDGAVVEEEVEGAA